MWTNSVMVFYMFRVINFAVLIGVIWYLFKKYALSGIEQQMADKQAFLKGLSEQNKVLQAQSSEMDAEIRDQAEECKELQNKIDQWRINFDLALEVRKKEKEVIKQKLDQRLHTQSEHIVEDRINQRIIPQAIEQAKIKLTKAFDDKKRSEKFMQDIFSFLAKR